MSSNIPYGYDDNGNLLEPILPIKMKPLLDAIKIEKTFPEMSDIELWEFIEVTIFKRSSKTPAVEELRKRFLHSSK